MHSIAILLYGRSGVDIMSDLCAYLALGAAISVWFVGYYILVYIELYRRDKK